MVVPLVLDRSIVDLSLRMQLPSVLPGPRVLRGTENGAELS